jgi:hypothetical protein
MQSKFDGIREVSIMSTLAGGLAMFVPSERA